MNSYSYADDILNKASGNSEPYFYSYCPDNMTEPYGTDSGERGAPLECPDGCQGFAASPSTAFSRVERAPKRVTFKPTATVRSYSPTMKEKKSELYYSKDEMKLFDLEARAICTLSQSLGASSPKDPSGSLGDPSMVDEQTVYDNFDSLRGLEPIAYPRRKQNKALAIRSLLKYQALLDTKPGMTPERKRMALAMAASRLNLWSSLVATETGRMDALRAYDGDYLIPIDAPPVQMPAADVSPFAFCRRKKRRVAEDAALERSGAEGACGAVPRPLAKKSRRKFEQIARANNKV